MKKLLILFFLSVLFFAACEKKVPSDLPLPTTPPNIQTGGPVTPPVN